MSGEAFSVAMMVDISDCRRVMQRTVLNVERKFWRHLPERQKYSKMVNIALFSLYRSGMSEQDLVEIAVEVYWVESN